MHADDGALLGRRLKGAKGLALLGAAVLTGALVVSIDDGSASDGAVSLASAAPSKIALIRTSTDPGGVRLELYVINADGSGARRLVETARPTTWHRAVRARLASRLVAGRAKDRLRGNG